ncbi:efflux RND transporter periplasmic adaptor subunit [Microvirga massiliensis]|uniref:efflux RND transporter periplasmic adaptor subunit n=1 Tax=Microvirga massiliensis TaxID=1033741 RepID=UPI00069BB028|nr:efflux RND transporter periplasmic adaptor subunit [Microvirga massiliensis]
MRTSVIAVLALVVLGGAGAVLLDGTSLDRLRDLGEQVMARAQGHTGRNQVAAPRPAGQQPATVPVETATAREVTSRSDIRSVGSLQSDESVQISSEVAGRVSEILFKEGQQVRAGEILVKLDDALTRAELGEAQARLALAEANYKRTSSLARSGNTTQRAEDEATSALETARAAVDLIKVRLDKLSITAPFSGFVGIRKVSVGAYVGPGSPLANLEKINELKVDFKVPEIHLADVKVGQEIEVTVDALPRQVFRGTIYAIDPMVDVNGRALTIRARLPNPDLVLRPGLFARITVKGQSEAKVVVVPEEAVVPRGDSALLYRVESGKAVETKVRLGSRMAGHVEILEGLAPEAIVVTAGQTRLRNGALVEVVSSTVSSPGVTARDAL